MKLLLTSAGLSNKAIGSALLEMTGRPASEVRVAFIPTAANVEPGVKDWVIAQFQQLWRYGFSQIDIVDFSAPGVDWEARLDAADVLFLSGGNTFHLLDQARKTGFDEWLHKNIEKKIYVGGSASTILVTPTIAVAGLEPGDKNLLDLTDLTGLGFVDFEVEPHCDAARITAMQAYASKSPNSLYAIDDETAIRVVNGKIDVISRGSWKLYE